MKTKSSIRILTTSAAALLAGVGITQSARAQAISITGPTVYTQNFDTLPTAAGNWADNSTIVGWQADSMNFFPANTPLNPIPLAIFTAGVTAPVRGFFSAGVTSERALAWSPTTTGYGATAMGVVFQNTSAAALTLGNFSYNGELYATQSTANGLDGFQFFYQIGATAVTDLASGGAVHANGSAYAVNAALADTGWTRLSAFDYATSNAAAAATTLAAAISTPISGNLNLTLAPGQFITLRWRNFNDSGTDALMGIDDVSIAFTTPIVSNNLTYNLAHSVGGAPNGTLAVSPSQYWLNGASPSGLAAADTVNFSQSPGAIAVINVPSNISVAGMNVSNTGGTYSIGGVGLISAPLAKTNAGTLILTSPNTFTSVTLDGGTIVTQNATALGATGISVGAAGGTLQADSDLSVGGFTGTGTLAKTGASALTTTAASAAAVTLDVNAGKLIIGPNFGFSNAASTINVNAGGALEATPTAATAIAGNVNLNNPAGSTITVNTPTETGASATGLNLTKANGITSAGPITKAGLGSLRVAGAQGLTNNWTVTGGFLEAQNSTALGTGTVDVNGGWISITGAQIGNAINLNGGGIGVRSGVVALPVENYTGTVHVAADSLITVRRTSTPTQHNGFFIGGLLTGSGALTFLPPTEATVGAGVAPNVTTVAPVGEPLLSAATSATQGVTQGAVTLLNTGNTYSGNWTVTSQQILSALPAGGTGNVFGTSAITLRGGAVRVLDNGTADNGTISYGSAITVAAPSDPVNPGVATVLVDRQTLPVGAVAASNPSVQGTFTGNTVQFTTLAIPAGQTIRTQGANGYKVGISGLTTISGTGNATFDTATASLGLAGGVGGTGGLTKVGVGLLQLSGVVDYAGNTTANAGLLDVTGVTGGFSVGTGKTLSGVGAVSGGVTITTGGTVAPGDATGVGALTLSDLALGAGSSLQYSFNAGSVGQLAVTGANTLLPTGGANSVTFNFNGSNAAIGVYPLIDYSGTPLTAGQFSAFKIGTLFQRILANLSNNAANTSVDLNVTGLDFPKWTGLGSSEWSTNVLNPTKNWVLATGGTPTDFIPNDKVLFDDSGTNTTVSISVADVTPSTVEVNNPTKAYTIGGAFGISGTTPFVKNGAAKLTLSSPNSFTGPITLNAGTTSVPTVENSGVNGPLGGGTGVNLAGGTLEFTGAAGSTNRAINLTAGVGSVSTPTGSTLTLTGVVSGAGTFNKAGAGTVVLTGLTNTPTAVTISTGTLQVGDGTVAGSIGTAPITNNGTLAFNTVAAGLLVPNTITGTGGLHKTGAGNVTLNGAAVANTFTGDTVVDGGSIVLSHTTDTNSVGGNVIVNTGGTVAYGTTAGQLANHIPDTATITINGGTFGSGAGNTEAAPTTGVFDTVAAVTLNSGTFLSGRGDATPFTITGSFNVLGGRALLSRGGSVSADSMTLTGGSTVDIDGGSTGVISRLIVGPNGLVLNGTTINMNAGPSAVAAGSQGSSIVLNGNVTSLVATTINRISAQAAPRAQFDVNGATRTFNVTDTLTLGTTAQKVNIVNSVTASPGGIIKSGTGNLILAGDNTYDGPTTIQQGTLTLTGTLSGSSRIDVQSGTTFNVAGVAGGFTLGATQTLQGNGSVVGTTTVGGTVAPGSSIGTLNFANDLIFGTGGQGLFEINKVGAVRTADLANVTGALTLAGTLNVTATGDTLVQGDKFNLFDAASFTGTMAPGTLPTLDPGLSWSLADLGTDGTISVVPEPASAALLVLGSTLLFRRRRQA